MEDPIFKRVQSSNPGEAVQYVSEDDPEALGLSRTASLTRLPLPPGDPGIGNNRLITGFTAQSRLRKAQDRAAYALEHVERLRQLQTTTQETLDDGEKLLRYIRNEIAGFQKSERQKELLVVGCKEEIEDRAKQIKEHEDLLLATQLEIEETEEFIRRRERKEEGSDGASEQQAEVVDLARAHTEALLDIMTKMSDDEFQDLLQRARLARNVSSVPVDPGYNTIIGTTADTTDEAIAERVDIGSRNASATSIANPVANITSSDAVNAAAHPIADTLVPNVVDAGTHPVNDGTPTQKRKAVEMETPENQKPEKTQHTQKTQQASIASGPATPLVTGARTQPSTPNNHDNVTTHTSHATKKSKKSHLPAKYQNLPRLTPALRTQFVKEGRCFSCHEIGHRKFESVCPLFVSSAYGPAPRVKPDRLI